MRRRDAVPASARGWASCSGGSSATSGRRPRPRPLFRLQPLLGLIAYLIATNRALNFLEQRESVNLTLQVAIAVGALLTLLAAADAVSGERERGTLESLLLTPVSGTRSRSASSWRRSRSGSRPSSSRCRTSGSSDAASASRRLLLTGLVVGTLLAVCLAARPARQHVRELDRVSLSTSLFVLLAVFAPTQLPSSAQSGWAGELMLRIDPSPRGSITSGKIVSTVTAGHEDISWLAVAARRRGRARPRRASAGSRLHPAARGSSGDETACGGNRGRAARGIRGAPPLTPPAPSVSVNVDRTRSRRRSAESSYSARRS